MTMPETIWINTHQQILGQSGVFVTHIIKNQIGMSEYVLRSSVQAMIDAAERRGMQKAIEIIDANISPCHAPGLWGDDERHAYLRGQIDASVSFIHSIRLSSTKIGGAE